MINGKEVSISLFELFSEESEEHIAAMIDFVESHYSEKTFLNEELMRHAHTLSSISRTVNMTKVAEISSLIEDISNVVIEKELPLNQDNMNVVRHAVHSLKSFKTLNSDSDESYFQNIIDHLNAIYTYALDAQEDVIEINHVAEVPKEEKSEDTVKELSVDKEEIEKAITTAIQGFGNQLLESVSNEVRKAVYENTNSFGDDLDKIRRQIAELSKDGEQEINFDVLVEKLKDEISGQNRSLINSLENENRKFRETLMETTQRLHQMEKELLSLRDEQSRIDKETTTKLDSVKKDIRILANIIKKNVSTNSKSFLQKLFGKK